MNVQLGADLLVEGERQFGQYQVQIARTTGDVWTVTIPPLHILATNYRLILWPQTRKPYPPASIPCTYIEETSDVKLGQWRGVHVKLATGHAFSMVVGGGQSARLQNNIRRMVLPPKQRRFFNPEIARHDIHRLIKLIERV